MNKIQFKSRKEASEFLASKNIDTSEWTEEKWQSINSSQAEIHIQALAEAMWDAMNESTPKELSSRQWHIPFGDKITMENFRTHPEEELMEFTDWYKCKIATARCARLSYMTFDNEIDYEKDIKLHDQLLESKHFSPFEHCARAMSNEEYELFVKGKGKHTTMHAGLTFDEECKGWCNNFRGFIPYRYLIENNNDRQL